jgi:hypothetical protein
VLLSKAHAAAEISYDSVSSYKRDALTKEFVQKSLPVEACTNEWLSTELAIVEFSGILALRKGIALAVRLAIRLRNADRLRPRLH